MKLGNRGQSVMLLQKGLNLQCLFVWFLSSFLVKILP
jgi:hypothetical protein